jgi:hypothetical protein
MSIAPYNTTNLLSTTEARIVPNGQDRALMTSRKHNQRPEAIASLTASSVFSSIPEMAIGVERLFDVPCGLRMEAAGQKRDG